jgi:hypothetical protein
MEVVWDYEVAIIFHRYRILFGIHIKLLGGLKGCFG